LVQVGASTGSIMLRIFVRFSGGMRAVMVVSQCSMPMTTPVEEKLPSGKTLA
jgi:hypothetical protein